MKHENFGKDCQVQLHTESKPFMKLVQETAAELKLQDKEDAFFLVDLGDIVKKVEMWRQCLPRVEPFYAVKCNPDRAVLRLLAHLGIGFDCASKKEMSEIVDLGVEPSRIVFAHTCKPRTDIRYAAQVNVDLMTFDNEEELRKIKAFFPSARLLLRILPPANFNVQYAFGDKFGCHQLQASSLLRTARDLGLDVVGVSFHVGSGVEEGEVYAAAVRSAATVFDEAHALGFHFHILDVGGGFFSAPAVFRPVAEVLRTALDLHFPEKRKVRIMAEPGRYFVEAAFSLTVTVIAKRRASPRVASNGNGVEGLEEKEAFEYYVNDGIHGSFHNVTLGVCNQLMEIRPVHPPENAKRHVSSLWGPTCNGGDKIFSDVMLPELQVGDVINFTQMGAYTICLTTSFNGIPRPLIFYHCCDTVWEKLFPTDRQTAEPEK
ncbi:ornithine decarboxylase-like [Littorina saxatilis]|uniref:ornithine decarboxylase n=1 Tax=Littorina saxatilis TaxID=31220 RepID=A0AAN9AYA1_9CAEN